MRIRDVMEFEFEIQCCRILEIFHKSKMHRIHRLVLLNSISVLV